MSESDKKLNDDEAFMKAFRASRGVLRDAGQLDVEDRLSDERAFVVWFRHQPLPGFSGATAEDLVRTGRINELLEYVAAVDAGIHS